MQQLTSAWQSGKTPKCFVQSRDNISDYGQKDDLMLCHGHAVSVSNLNAFFTIL